MSKAEDASRGGRHESLDGSGSWPEESPSFPLDSTVHEGAEPRRCDTVVVLTTTM